MRQELDAIPAEAEGAALTRVQIEACMEAGIPVARWAQADDFRDAPEEVRKADARDWCERELRPVLAGMNRALRHFAGEDFARSGDVTDIAIAEELPDLTRRTVLVVELRNIPFDQQRDILYYVFDRVPRLTKAALDKTGNGAYLAEKAAQRYGSRVIEVHFSQEWYRAEMPAYIEAFSDRTVILPQHADILQDHQALQYVNGVVRVPEGHRFKGSDGYDRHGDSAIAGALMWFASRQQGAEYGYQPVGADDDEDPDAWDIEDAPGFRRHGGLW